MGSKTLFGYLLSILPIVDLNQVAILIIRIFILHEMFWHGNNDCRCSKVSIVL